MLRTVVGSFTEPNGSNLRVGVLSTKATCGGAE